MDILQIGFGGVGKALNELFHLEKINIRSLTIIEPLNLPSWAIFTKHIKVALTAENINQLDKIITKQTYVIDVSVDVDCMPVMEICKRKGAKYINTSLESWDDDNDDGKLKINKDTVLFHRMKKAEKLLQGATSTILTDSGANPGLVSSFVKQALKDVAEKYKDEESIKYINKQEFNLAAERMGVELIHISEIDTQEYKYKMKPDTFYNTWSCEGFQAEALDPVSIGFGSCENNKSKQWIKPTDAKNPIIRVMKKRGCDVIQKSYCLDHKGKFQKIEGYCIPHGESFTICRMLQHNDYRPSVYYVYCCSPPAMESINRMKENNYEPLPNDLVLSLNDIKNTAGFDSVGTLLFFSGKGTIPKLAHWYGSSLSVKEVKQLGFKHSNPTVVQVAESLLSALKWIQKHQDEGLITPEDLNYKYMIENSKKYLGKIYSKSFKYPETSPLCFEKFNI